MSDIFDLFKKIEKKPPTTNVPISFILAGLGNPGDKYTFTRHNAGFLAVEYHAEKYNFKVDRSRFKSICGEMILGGKRGLVIKPQTFMNNSGEAIREAADFYKIAPENIIVFVDDISLAPGKLRLRKKGSDGGHNGLKSIIYQLNSDNFPRVKIGVGAKPHPDYDLVDWVLGTFPDEDKKLVFDALTRAADGLPTILSGDYEKAMNLLN